MKQLLSNATARQMPVRARRRLWPAFDRSMFMAAYLTNCFVGHLPAARLCKSLTRHDPRRHELSRR